MNRYYLIDHKILFFFGYVFYLFTPYLIGVTDVFHGFPGMELYQGFFKRIPEGKLITYAQITFLWLPSFYLGHLCFKFLKPYKQSLLCFTETPADKGLPYVSLLLLFVLLLFTYISRNSIFGGYDSYDIGARGKMSTLLVVFNFFLAYQLITRQRMSVLLVIGTITTALLLLTMGGRMYAMQTFLIFLIYKTSFAKKRFTTLQIIVVSVLGFFIAGFIGIHRLGASFSIDRAAYSFLAEPAFTWFSTSTYLISNDIPLFNVPQNFLTSFLNLVPNTFFSLQPYVVSTHAMAVNYESPLGADSIWTNIVINFGSVGSFFFLFITGFMLNFLRHLSEKNRFAAVYYIMVCSILPFQFFRDGFYILNKQLFFNFLILPGMVLLVLKFLQYTLRRLTPISK
jgi:hypothetical protein